MSPFAMAFGTCTSWQLPTPLVTRKHCPRPTSAPRLQTTLPGSPGAGPGARSPPRFRYCCCSPGVTPSRPAPHSALFLVISLRSQLVAQVQLLQHIRLPARHVTRNLQARPTDGYRRRAAGGRAGGRAGEAPSACAAAPSCSSASDPRALDADRSPGPWCHEG